MNAMERAGYLAYAQTALFKRRVERGLGIIQSGLKMMKSPYVSMSFGKDSMAMTHLILSIAPDLPVVYVNCGEFDEWPDTPRVKAEFVRQCSCQLIELPGPSIIDYYRRAGYVYMQDAEETREARRIQREYGESLEHVIIEYAHEQHYDGGFIGMRADESHWREFQLKRRGPLYFAQQRNLWTCCPLADWSARDVWAYSVLHALPYNDLYDRHPRGRELARNGAMIGTRGASFGRLTWLKQMYPDWWSRFTQEFPEIARNL